MYSSVIENCFFKNKSEGCDIKIDSRVDLLSVADTRRAGEGLQQMPTNFFFLFSIVKFFKNFNIQSSALPKSVLLKTKLFKIEWWKELKWISAWKIYRDKWRNKLSWFWPWGRRRPNSQEINSTPQYVIKFKNVVVQFSKSACVFDFSTFNSFFSSFQFNFLTNFNIYWTIYIKHENIKEIMVDWMLEFCDLSLLCLG